MSFNYNRSPFTSQPLNYLSELAGGQHLSQVSKFSDTTSPHELSAHLLQLRSFISACGAGLSRVTSLELTFKESVIDSHSCHETSCEKFVSAINHANSDAAGVDVAHTIANNFPHVQHVGLGGGVGLAAASVLKAECHSLTSLELLDDCLPEAVLRVLMKRVQLPHITRLTLGLTQDAEKTDAGAFRLHVLLNAVRFCAALTHLRTGGKLLDQGDAWLALPLNLKDLQCSRLPLEGLPTRLALSHLTHIQFREFGDGISTSELIALLAAAPQLQVMSGVDRYGMWENPDGAGNWLRLEPCARDAMLDLHRLQWRLEAGLVLNNMHVRCVSSMESQAQAVPFATLRPRVDLSKLNSFFTFKHYILHDQGILQNPRLASTDGGGPVEAQNRCQGLALSSSPALEEIQIMLPHLTHLTLEGVWSKADLETLTGCRSLKNIFVVGLRGITKEDLVQLVVHMPWLQQLCHDARIYTSTHELRALLRAGYGGSSGGDQNAFMDGANEWIVCHLSSRNVQEMWFTQAALRSAMGENLVA